MRNPIVELCESRRLLAFSPDGAPVVVDPTTVTGVDAMSGLADGRYVVVFTNSGAAAGLYARLYDADDTPISAAMLVSAGGPNGATPGSADVSMAADGSFVVTYAKDDGGGNGSDIYARQFSAFGVAIANSFPVNTLAAGEQVDPRIGVASNGTFAITWDDQGAIVQRRFNADGTPGGVEATVAIAGTNPDIAMNGAGQYVIVYDSGSNVVAQEYSSAGANVGAATAVTVSGGVLPVVGIATDTSFVVAWTDSVTTPSDVFYRRYNAAGSPIAGAQNAASDATGDESFPQVDVAGSGKFVVGWRQPAGGGGGPLVDLGFRAFASNGTALSDDTVISSTQSNNGRFGVLFRDNTQLRVGYAAGGAALVQPFQNQIVINLDNTGQVVQIFGSSSNIRVVIDGSTTNYGDPDGYTGIVINGGDGADYIRAKNISLPMTVTGGAGDDTITSGDGPDYIDAGLGNDAVNTQGGDDYAYGADETDTMFGGDGNDTLTGGPGRNWLYGENGNDLLNGSNRPDVLYGGPGNDRLRGFNGGDALFGENGADHLEGMGGNDNLDGGNHDDYLEGGGAYDRLIGGRGNDTLLGQQNVDTLYGNAGADLLNGGEEADYGFYDLSDVLISIEIRRLVV